VAETNAQNEIAPRERAGVQFEEFLDDCGLSRAQAAGMRILELGFGQGLFLRQCQEAGMIVTGLEVRPPVYEKTRQAFPDMDLRLYDGSTIPAEADAFDCIVSFQVLEHVSNLEALFDECVRVLRPGGLMYHRMPNYRSFYEGHYKIPWLPFLNKRTGRVYMKMLGKYTDYYESLNIIKPADIRRLCRDRSEQIELISDGREHFGKYMADTGQLRKIKNRFVRAIAGAVCRIKPLRQLGGGFLLMCDMYYPMLLLARKKIR